MKLEIGESLGYSYLRHIQKCWIVQANWKASDHWEKSISDQELTRVFDEMRDIFGSDKSVFKQNDSWQQFLKQGEIDLMGVTLAGDVHALDVAFHENGLQYGSETHQRVLKKMLRTHLILMAYGLSEESQRHVYFVSPKVTPKPQRELEQVFRQLRTHYPNTDWHLLSNEEFRHQMLLPLLNKVGQIADTSELFVRGAQLLNLGGLLTPEAAG